MIRGRIGVVIWLSLVALAAGGVYVSLFHLPEPPGSLAPEPVVIGGVSVEPEVAARSRVVQRARRGAEPPITLGEHEAGGGEPRRLARDRRQASAVARRFYRAFSVYELDRLGRASREALRATTSRPFARELLSAPPRIPTKLEGAAAARIARATFVAGASRQEGGLGSATLVAITRRDGGANSPIAIDLERDRAGWHVAGLSR
jgi:hypothetical protein